MAPVLHNEKPSQNEQVFTSTCSYDCGARCVLKVRVSDGRIQKITPDDRFGPGLKPCARGLAQMDVIYAPDRLTVPLKRTGERGSGKFEEIGWDEALDTVAAKLKSARDAHGPRSVFCMNYSGSISPLHNVQKVGNRFFSLFGGCTTWHGNSSMEAASFSSLMTFGWGLTGNSRDNFLESKIIILWGWNPLDTRFGPDTAGFLLQAKKKGVRIVSVDPRSSASTETLADEWIAIKPGTDTAMLIAMAYVMIYEDLYDRAFIEAHTSGFDTFRQYVTGEEDGLAKTPAWAEKITGAPKESIEKLAREYAALRPGALCAGWAPGRTAFGEQYHRAASVLAAMTGNIGLAGGNVAGGTDVIPKGYLTSTLPAKGPKNPKVHITEIYDLLLKGKSGGYPGNIRLLYIIGCNMLNQFLNLNKGIQALQKPEFIVAHELFMTPTARYADIVLPAAHFLERDDIGQPFVGGPYNIVMEKTVDPRGQARSDLAIFTGLASRLGISGFNDKTDAEWLNEFTAKTPGMPSYEALKEKKVYLADTDGRYIAFRDQIENPGQHPFPTPTGKIEIYSRKMAEMGNPLIPPIPKYLEAWEGPNDAAFEKYPILLVSPHSKARVNSTLDNIPRLKKIADDSVWINPQDAHTRGILDGGKVRIHNGRGQLIVTAKVTGRIMRGVASLDAGAWYRPDDSGIDQGGCVNVLTRDAKSPAGAFPSNTCLVQIDKL
jgi:anaerobic dimethyl sulfoxide reductase subunit A